MDDFQLKFFPSIHETQQNWNSDPNVANDPYCK